MAGEVLRPTAKTLQETFTETLQLWNGFLESQPVEACQEVIPTITMQLNQLLGWQKVIGTECVVNGFALWSEAKLHYESGELTEEEYPEQHSRLIFDIDHKQGEVRNLRGICCGIGAPKLPGQERPELYYIFESEGWQFEGHPTMPVFGCNRAYVKTGDASIVSARDFEAPFVEYPDDTVWEVTPQETITKASLTLMQLISSTGFRRLKRKEQERRVEDLIKRAEAEGLIKEAEVVLEPEYGYVNEISPEGKMNYLPLALGGMCVSGTCLGLSMLSHQSLSQKAIRRDSDLLNKRDGLSMSIEIDEPLLVQEYVFPADTIVHIPLCGQEFDCIIQYNPELYKTKLIEDSLPELP